MIEILIMYLYLDKYYLSITLTKKSDEIFYVQKLYKLTKKVLIVVLYWIRIVLGRVYLGRV